MFITNWLVAVILYLIFAVMFNQGYKIVTKSMENSGALTVLMEGLAGLFCLLLIPIFDIKFPTNPYVYLFLGLACIFYALNDRIATDVRKGLEASAYSIIKQISTVFMIIAGLVFFKEEFVLTKIIGALLIVLSNILVFYKKGSFKNNKYVWLGLLASIFNTTALIIDVNYSKQFNLALYAGFTLLVPALLILIFERIKFKDIKNEFKIGNKKVIMITGLSWALMMVLKLRAYELGEVIIVAPLCSLTAILNVIVGYLLLKEKDNLWKKILAAILIIISIFLIKL